MRRVIVIQLGGTPWVVNGGPGVIVPILGLVGVHGKDACCVCLDPASYPDVASVT